MRTPSFFINGFMVVCVGAALIVAGCSSGSKIAKNAKGNVYLEEVTDWSFEANHPAVIDQLTIAKIVKGVYGNNDGSGSPGMSAGGSKPMRVFSDEDAEFLAPLLAQGLSKAKPEQLVGFHVSSSAGSGSEPTTGSIYVQDGLIHFTISKGAGSTTFLPESAARTEHAPPYAANGMAGVTAHVIDFHALANSPMPAAMAVIKPSQKIVEAPIALAPESPAIQQEATMTATPSAAMSVASSPDLDQTASLEEALTKKETEISVLRKEAEWMKRKLRDRDEEVKALKASVTKAQAKRRAAAQKTR